MNYAAFTSFVRTFLWKQNDTDLANNIDNLIVMANAELSRRLDLKRREMSVTIAPEVEDYELPTDFRHMVSLTGLVSPYRGTFSNTTATEIYTARAYNPGSAKLLYHVAQGSGVKLLQLVGPFSVSTPGSLGLVYRAAIPDFATEDESWLADDYLDLYTYTVLAHTAPFLREDERVPLWQNMREACIMSAIEEDKHNVDYGGSPLKMQPHRRVP